MLSPEQLFSPQHKEFLLLTQIYALTEKYCSQAPLRKNGEKAFLHPLNVALNLRRAQIPDEIVLCIGLLHDVVEDHIDTLREERKKELSSEELELLEEFRQRAFAHLEEELASFCTPQQSALISGGVRLVTRRRTETYYSYIKWIFSSPDTFLKEAAIQAKLADRIHNVLCIAHFNEEVRIHECFKNIFMLNNVKKYLLDMYGTAALYKKPSSPMERLFTQCCKATYDAFLTICTLAQQKGIEKTLTLLQLALMKFAFEMQGMWEVTQLNVHEVHPLRLYQGVVRKYDLRLRHQHELFQQIKNDEFLYCKNFFAEHAFSDEQLQAVLDYKDAYGLKEVVARLLYLPEYVLSGFLVSELTPQGELSSGEQTEL